MSIGCVPFVTDDSFLYALLRLYFGFTSPLHTRSIRLVTEGSDFKPRIVQVCHYPEDL